MSSRLRLGLEALFFLGLAAGFVAVVSDTRESVTPEQVEQAELAPSAPSETTEGIPGGTLLKHQPESTYEGFTLLPVEGNATVHLIDMRGEIVNTWNVDATRARLLPNGHLLVIHGTKWGTGKKEWDKLREHVTEYDWDGNVVWDYEAADVAHHDVHRLENGNTLFLQRVMVPDEYKHLVLDQTRRAQPIRSDAVLEVTPQGEIAWRWDAHAHLDLNSCGDKGCVEKTKGRDALKKMRDWTHMNTSSVIPENQWYRAGHKEFKPGNIIVLPRNWWTVMIIDRDSGDVVWRYNGDYRGGISGGHEAHIIPEGLPGAGNMLIFDNGRKVHPGESIILEINPVTRKIVWVYENGEEFYSVARGSVQRLPNGNTLISECRRGHCFEVTPEKEIVWSYKVGPQINRCARYSASYAPQLEALS